MDDFEYESMMKYHDVGTSTPDPEEECVDDPPQESKTCCRCNQSFPFHEHMFDCDSCSHLMCAACRFKDAACVLCKPLSKKEDISAQVGTVSGSVKELRSKFFKRSLVSKDHIVDVAVLTTDGNVRKQMCTICKRVFKKSNARYHYSCATGEKPHECVECGQKFVKKSHLDIHLNNHYGVRPFKCTRPKCKASFTQKDKLTRHMKSHDKDTRLMCPLCDKLYSSQDILTHHMIKVHSSTKQFKCDQCPRTYKYPSSLRVHRLKHQAKRDYMCEVCGKKYVLAAQLTFHKRSHVVYHRRPFKCRHCVRRFMSQRDKSRHELTHYNSHDYECSLCNTTFKRKDNLERHMKNFHQETPVMPKKVATVAPYHIKPTFPKKGDRDLKKKATVKDKECPLEKQPLNKRSKPKVKTNRKPASTKKVISKFNCTESEKVSTEKSNQTATKPTSDSIQNPLSRMNSKESIQKPSVIVSPKQSTPQNRPSVIRSVPNLLPYRVLPPDKRFLKLNEEPRSSVLANAVAHSQTQTKANMEIDKTYTKKTQNNTSTVPENVNIVKVKEKTTRAVENRSKPPNRQRIPKDDALNRCYRIIQHTGSASEYQSYASCAGSVQSFDPRTQRGNSGAAMITFKSRRQQTRFSSTAVSTPPAYEGSRFNQVRQNTTAVNSMRSTESTGSTTTSNIGGPSLSAVHDSVSEISHEENFTSSYSSMGETAYSSSSYTPYYESDYFRDSMTSYDAHVEQLLPNDLDIGFQDINEELGCPEMTLTSESRIIRHVSQETRIVRESSDDPLN